MLTFECFSAEKQSSVFVAILFAKEVIHIIEAKRPSDMRPRKVIEAAELWLSDRTTENVVNTINAAYAIATNKYCRSVAAAAYAVSADKTESAYYAFEAVLGAYAVDFNNSYAEIGNYIHKILLRNLSIIFDFHIKECIAFEKPEVVFQYLNNKEKEEFVYEMNILVKSKDFKGAWNVV